MISESESVWKEAVLAWFKVLTRHLPAGIEESYKNLSQDNIHPSWDWNLAPQNCCPLS
jgi:hypothetical protein